MSHSRSSLPFLLALLLVATPLLGGPAATPTGPVVSADVVVTAEASPAESAGLGVAATVIGPDEIARSKATTLLDLLRTVPGLDVAQSGGPGGVGSLFLRGSNSNQFLLLVDGVKVNSPYFGGADLASFSTANVERIEVVRGPFSALYGSEAIGGVVQVFTRRAVAGLPPEARASLSAGSLSAREATASASWGSGPVGVSAGFRRSTVDGDLPNSGFAVTNLSAALDLAAAPWFRVGAAFRHDTSRTGIPFSGADVTPRRETTADTTTLSVPLVFNLSPTTTVEAAATFASDRPGLTDPDDPFGFTFSRTDARRAGGRLLATHTSGSNRISAGADWERTLVRNEDSYGLELNNLSPRTWAVFLEDRLSLWDGKVSITAGLRRDDHSAFGSATSPRVTLLWRAAPALKLRAAGGSAFRAPTTGELYYPFSGNARLAPERSSSFEVGADWDVAPRLTLEATVYRTSVRDLIRYDFATNENVNVGRARMTGLETGLRGRLAEGLEARVSWSWLDSADLDTGLPLLRRPRHRASAALGASLGKGASAELTGIFVGRRDDVDAVTYARVTDPSYLRFDLAVTGPRLLEHLAPFVRMTNLLGRSYVEVAGFPSPGRRFLAGLDVAF